MKTTDLIKKTIWYACLLLFRGTPLWAVEAAERVDNIDMLMWIFLGFCALIVVSPLIAALLVLFGFSTRDKREKAESMAPLTETFDTVLIRYLSLK